MGITLMSTLPTFPWLNCYLTLVANEINEKQCRGAYITVKNVSYS